MREPRRTLEPPATGPWVGPGRARVPASARALTCALLVTGCFRGEFLNRTCEELGTCDTTTTGTATTGTTTTGTTTTGTTGQFGEDIVAFRINALSLVDPHFYAAVPGCTDITDILNLAILPPELAKGEVNVALLFPEYEDGAMQQTFVIERVECDVPESMCYRSGASLFGFFTKIDVGSCSDNPIEAMQPENIPLLNDPQGPCFQSLEATVTLQLTMGIDEIELIDGRTVAAFDNPDDPQTLVDGVIRGFVTQAKAETLNFDLQGMEFNLWQLIQGGMACVPPEMPPPDVDMHMIDGELVNGVWLFLNFTGERVTYSPFPPEGGDTDTGTGTGTGTSTGTGTGTGGTLSGGTTI